jgi:hypothetical protein
MEFATAVLVLISLLSLMVLGLVFSIFVMLIRGTARAIVRPPEEFSPPPPPPPPPPSEEELKDLKERVKVLVNKLVDKGTITRAEADVILSNL